MRIVFVTPYIPSRIRVRPFQLIKALSAVHEISLVALLCDVYERGLVDDVASYCASVDLVPLPRMRAYTNCLRALPTGLPLRVAYYQSPSFIKRIQQIINARSIDIVHGELIKVMPALRTVGIRRRLPVLYDSVDCISWYLEQQRSSACNPLKKAFIATELKKMRLYEPAMLAGVDRVAITSQHDREVLLRLGVAPEHIKVVPNGVDLAYFTPPIGPRDSDSLVFCAKMDYYPNSQAILDFCREVLPRIWEQRPQVHLTIVGNNPPQAVRDLGTDKRITVTGYVPDTRPYLGAASLALAPLLVAAGMQNKVLEALAMGTPLVATPGSCRSLQVKDGEHLLVAEGARDYASAVLKLLANNELARRLGQAGRDYVERYHSWDAAATMLNRLYEEMQAHRGQHDQDAALVLK